MRKYENQIQTDMNMSLNSIGGMLKDSVKGRAARRPAGDVRIQAYRAIETGADRTGDRVTWFGHSAFLLEMDGKILLFDPMLGERPSPVAWAGSKRFSRHLPLEPESFPEIDAIVISHDHYDHLDYSSIRKLMDKTARFIVPMGVRRRLIGWGVPSDKITEHAWGDEVTLGGELLLACTPARHFSGRGLFDRNRTLWCSWVIIGKEKKVFYSGDSGYGPHFKEIGSKYGPFHLTLMECGQYDKRWSAIHMVPEETVQAHLDLKGQLLLPVHWGAFTLAFHTWTDPVERVTKAAAQRGVNVTTPLIGETVTIDSEAFPTRAWWKA